MSEGEQGEVKVDLLSLPVEVIDSFVLPHLEWNDLLRFRRVCKWTKEITSGYLKVHPELAPEIQIDEEGDKNLSAFLGMRIPTTRIFFNNLSGDEFYKVLGIAGADFPERYGSLVKHLRVAQVSRYMYGMERNFLDSLSNLESFEAGHFGYGGRNVEESEIRGVLAKKKQRMVNDPGSEGGVLWYPSIFEKLKTLRISHNMEILFRGNHLAYKDVLICSTSVWEALENVMLPISLNREKFSYQGVEITISQLFLTTSHFTSSISQREAGHQWKMFDFGGFHSEFQLETGFIPDRMLNQSSVFLDLCQACVENDIKLLNVNSWWFRSRIHFPEQASPQLGIPVVSLVNLHPWMLPLDMENLEKLEIRETSKSGVGNYWARDRREWPALKVMDITVNSKYGRYRYPFRAGNEHWVEKVRTTAELFQFLFQGISRPGMEELRLNFTSRRRLAVFVPNVEDILAACPNLKKLTLIKWPGGNEDFVKLWEGLGNLEEIHLESCKNLGDSAFLGEDETTPVFLKLTKLRSLTLNGLDMMPQVTNRLFTTVIRQMNLKRLILTSDQPLKTVTLGGVESLLEGRFADSIEKFPFQDWSLEGVSNEKFRELETKFRSYNML